MDRVFAVEEVSDQFWSPSPNISPDELSKMNRSASEWSFQRFLQEASASQTSSISLSTSPLSSSSSSAADHQGDVVLVNVKDGLSKPKSTIDPNIKNIKHGSTATASFGVTPPYVPIDSEEYQAFLKSKLHLACAAVASRGSLSKAQDSAALADSVPQTFKTSQLGTKTLCKGAGYDSSRSQEKDPNGSLGMQKKSGASLKSTTSGSSKEQTDDDEVEVEGEIENMDPDYAKRVRRMLSNRESARRSRRRKQVHLTDLETQVSQLKVENSSLLKRLTDISQKYNAAAVDNRVLKADVDTLRAKIKMAEETVKRVTGLNPKDHAMLDLSSISISSFGPSPSETLTDAAVPVQDDPNNHLYQPVSSNSVPPNDQSVHSGLKDINSVENMQHISEPTAARGVNKIGRTSSMQSVASLEHLQKRIRGDGNPCGVQTKSDS